MILFVYAIICFNIVLMLLNDKALYGWFYGIYVVATVLPPLLPTVFTVSVGISDDRLSRKRIATAQSESILIAGKVTHAFFDKTGTLTKQGLDFLAVRTLSDEPADTWKQAFLEESMAVCHALVPSANDELIGNPVDYAMFRASGARLVSVSSETGTKVELPSGESMCIVRRFEFCHHQMLQSVIVQTGSPPRFHAIVKGSGQSVAKVCRSESLPDNFFDQVAQSARSGIYQISMAYKELPHGDNVFDLSREDVESDLSFLGVLDFRNVMRPESPEMIRQLRNGAVAPAMVTGDAVETGIRIALECGILFPDQDILVGDLAESGNSVNWKFENQSDFATSPDMVKLKQGEQQLALSGKAWSYLLNEDPDFAYLLAPYVNVFGRCTPHDKVTVIRTMVALGHVTLMCGDGGNDTGALKAVSGGT
jgi:cation-transporting ATPase 13A3/4/5